MKSKIISFSAPSGSGKTTIIQHILNIKELNLSFSISACSRNKRANEIEGLDYYFLSIEDFKNRIKNNEFIEWEEVYKDHYYGSLKSEVDRLSALGKNIIFDIDVMGGINIKKIYKEAALTIFIMPPSLQELEKRLINRSTDKMENIITRVKKAESEIKYAQQFDKIIINDDLATTLKETEQIVRDFINT